MTSRTIRLLILSLGMISLLAESVVGQDSAAVSSPGSFSSFGLQASTVSGIGLSYRRTMDNRFRTGAAGGVIKTEGETVFTFGFDLQYELSTRPDLHIFIGPGFGFFGGSNRALKTRLGFGTGIEVPLFGNELYQNISVGGVLYYPTYFVYSETIGFAVGVFLYYSF